MKRSDVPGLSPDFVGALGQRIKRVVDLIGGPGKVAPLLNKSEMQISRYIKAENVPPTDVLVGLALAGKISIGWLAAEQGSMRPAECGEGPVSYEVPAKEPPPLDQELLEAMIEAVEIRLSELGRTLAPEKKARLIRVLYELHQLEGEEKPNREVVLRLVDRAA